MKAGLGRFIAATLSLMLSACAFMPEQAPQPFLSHIVLIWLKDPGNLEQREQIIEASQVLRQIPGVVDLDAGSVVLSDRAVVEDSYDVALNIRFENAAALQTYLQHPIHTRLVKETLAPVLLRYQVIDFAGFDD